MRLSWHHVCNYKDIMHRKEIEKKKKKNDLCINYLPEKSTSELRGRCL